MSQQRKKTALVTGGSSGIGYAVAKELGIRGWTVYAAARRTELMEPLKEFGVIPVKLDAASVESCAELKAFLNTELKDGKLDVLFNNAGTSCTSPCIDVSDERVEHTFAVNVFAPIRLTRELQDFVIAAQGTILFTGSISGLISFPFSSIYCSTKAAIHSFAHVLHLEMKPFGVRVINVVTGTVSTDIADKSPIPVDTKFASEEFVASYHARRMLAVNNRPMSAEDYAKSVIADIESKRDPIDVYRGNGALVMSYAAYWLPSWLWEYGLALKFKLNPLFDVVRKKYYGDETHLD